MFPRHRGWACLHASVCARVCIAGGVICGAGRSDPTETGMERQQSLGEPGLWRSPLGPRGAQLSGRAGALGSGSGWGCCTCCAGLSGRAAVATGTSSAGSTYWSWERKGEPGYSPSVCPEAPAIPYSFQILPSLLPFDPGFSLGRPGSGCLIPRPWALG